MSVGNEDGDSVVSHTTRLFIDGPVRRVLDIAAAVRDSGETLSLDEELRRFVRITRVTGVTDWVCPIATVAALFDHVAGLRADGMEALPQEFWASQQHRQPPLPAEPGRNLGTPLPPG